MVEMFSKTLVVVRYMATRKLILMLTSRKYIKHIPLIIMHSNIKDQVHYNKISLMIATSNNRQLTMLTLGKHSQ